MNCVTRMPCRCERKMVRGDVVHMKNVTREPIHTAKRKMVGLIHSEPKFKNSPKETEIQCNIQTLYFSTYV